MVEPNFTEQTGQLHTVSSFIVVRVYYWTTVEWKELLPDSSMSHLDYESRIYDIGLCGTSMRGICYIIAEQYWEAWGLFWKRSVSLCFLGVLFGFGCWVGCVVVCCLVFVFVGDTLIIVSPFLSYEGIANQNKMYWWPSELRARTAPPKKKCNDSYVAEFVGDGQLARSKGGVKGYMLLVPSIYEAILKLLLCFQAVARAMAILWFSSPLCAWYQHCWDVLLKIHPFWWAFGRHFQTDDEFGEFPFVLWRETYERCAFGVFLGICSHLVAWELATTGVFEISGRFACIW